MSRTPPDSRAFSTVSRILTEDGYDGFGAATLERPLSIDVYRDWVDEGMGGDMEYLRAHLAQKETPQSQMSKARSAISVQVMYAPHPVPPGLEIDVPLFRSPRVALYARGRDYHRWLINRLKATCEKLQVAFPGEEFLPMSDSSPVLERDLAFRSGLGWVGKNTCLIHPKKGSLFFIGEIYTTLDLQAAAVVTDHCGTCTRCLDACPTGALVAPRKLDARLCISYLTIESATIPAEPLRTQIGDWLFGCDICQTVCPWNIKFNADGMSFSSGARESSIADDLRWILGHSKNQLSKHLRVTALNRAAGPKLKRNALIVAGNRRVGAVRDLVESYTGDALLGELAQWALAQIDARA